MSSRHVFVSQKLEPSTPLTGPTSWFWTTDVRPSPSLYTHENAPGIVLATGNVGEFLDTTGDRTCTWMSQDGGLTWADIANHAAMYEFGDHGNIVVVSSFMTQAPTDKVFFSIDDGRCFNTVELDEAIYVENIRCVLLLRSARHEVSAWKPNRRHPYMTC